MNDRQNPLPILVVDDDEPTQKLLQAVLRRSGYDVVLAANGAEAIECLNHHQYSAVVLDLMMPTVGGREVIEFLGRSSIRVPVIVCSAAGTKALTGFDEDVVKAVIRKPFDVAHLVATVAAVT